MDIKKEDFKKLSNEEKFKEFYKFCPYVMDTIIRSKICDNLYKEPQDILNEIFCTLWLNIDKYDPDKSKLITYLKTVTRNVITNNWTYKSRNKNLGKTLSMSQSVGRKHENFEIQDILSDENQNIEELLVSKNVVNDIINNNKNIKDREKSIVLLKYGINTTHPHTLEEIGKKLELSYERVRVLLNKTIEKLKDMEIKEEM